MQAGADWNRAKNAENTKGILFTTDFTDATDGNGFFGFRLGFRDWTEGKPGNEEGRRRGNGAQNACAVAT